MCFCELASPFQQRLPANDTKNKVETCKFTCAISDADRSIRIHYLSVSPRNILPKALTGLTTLDFDTTISEIESATDFQMVISPPTREDSVEAGFQCL